MYFCETKHKCKHCGKKFESYGLAYTGFGDHYFVLEVCKKCEKELAKIIKKFLKAMQKS